MNSFDVCVVGAGPAGSVIAARLAQLGFTVCLVERAVFPRRHLGESLSPGVLPMLEMIGARVAVLSAGRRVRAVMTNWDGPLRQRVDEREQGLLVDRGRFDDVLVTRARALGVSVLQPASVRRRELIDERWTLHVDAPDGELVVHSGFLIDATGRSAMLPGQRHQTGPRTLALYAYWRGRRVPDQPRIEAGEDAWYWGVPLPDGTYNTLVFVDGARFRGAEHEPLENRFRELLARSGLMDECDGATLVGSVMAADATPYVDEASVTRSSLKVGDAALAIDPLSSSGVQKAIQTALSGAIVVNTLLRRPESGDAAIRFYEESLAQASERHCSWAAGHYRTVAEQRGGAFWTERSRHDGPPAASRAELDAKTIGARVASDDGVELSPDLEFVDVPRLGGEFVALGPALRHPGLDAPIAYLGGWELAPLVRDIRAGMTPLQIVRSWSPRIPMESGIAIAGWLIGHGLLMTRATSPTLDTRNR